MARDQGIARTIDRVRGRLSAGQPTGYSAAGAVIAVADDVHEFSVGDRVACAGAGIANHAEIINVPVNLTVRVPDTVSLEDASTVTLGAIALQGIRRCGPTLGETILVVGLGLLGQLTLQMLRANGCRVIGVDPDARRAGLAADHGAVAVLDPSADEQVAHVSRLTDGYGADAAIVTASGTSNEIISAAMQCCRRKGRVVLVGDVGLGLTRADFYAKELDFLISTSYGPGRYDAAYEEGGIDYPLPYVRWTENRNMQAYLALLREGRVSLAALRNESFDVANAGAAYDSLKGADRRLISILRYPERDGERSTKVELASRSATTRGRIRISVIGAGSFAQGVHLPNLVRLRDRFAIRGIVTRTGANAKAVAGQYAAAFASCDPEDAIEDQNTDLVLIATRHDLHARLTLRALEAGKHVLVEKPLALHEPELDAIEAFYRGRGSPSPLLMTGFNRRFAPPIVRARKLLAQRSSPMIVNYRMNAGHIPRDHWVHGPEGGGRNLGEACHIYDLFGFLTGSEWVAAEATTIRPQSGHWRQDDNFVATVRFDDGSVCTLTYTALGDRSHPKESMDIFCDGLVISLRDYTELRVSGRKTSIWQSGSQQKGQFEELEALANALRDDGDWPIELASQLAATRLSFRVQQCLSGGN
jgi:predicted dehydrogenase/threonine dehydrogenase-like Zn-dependent dehydrogenase